MAYVERYYLDGKCILSIDWDVFSSDEQYRLIMEEFIDPIRSMVYEKYYEKQLKQQAVEKILKEEDIVFQAYCHIKPLIEDENFDINYIVELMEEELTVYKYENFRALRNRIILAVNKVDNDFFCGNDSPIIEHFWCE